MVTAKFCKKIFKSPIKLTFGLETSHIYPKNRLSPPGHSPRAAFFLPAIFDRAEQHQHSSSFMPFAATTSSLWFLPDTVYRGNYGILQKIFKTDLSPLIMQNRPYSPKNHISPTLVVADKPRNTKCASRITTDVEDRPAGAGSLHYALREVGKMCIDHRWVVRLSCPCVLGLLEDLVQRERMSRLTINFLGGESLGRGPRP